MLRRTLALAATCLWTAASGAQQPMERLFYYVDREDSYKSLVDHIAKISVIGGPSYQVDSLGVVWGDIDPRVLELARANRVRVMPLLVNEGFHQPSVRRLLADTAARNRATQSMVEVCRRYGVWGWQFDIENVSVQDRDRLTDWYRRTAESLKAANCAISIAVVHRPDERRRDRRQGFRGSARWWTTC